MPTYMKLMDKRGNSVLRKRKEFYDGWIEVSYATTPMPTSSGGARGAGSPNPVGSGDVIVVREMDDASPDIFRLAAAPTSLPIDCAINFVRNEADKPTAAYLSVKLENAMISSYIPSGSDKPMETMSFTYSDITYTNKG